MGKVMPILHEETALMGWRSVEGPRIAEIFPASEEI